MENGQDDEIKNKFEELVKKLHEIRNLMKQTSITCEFSGKMILVIAVGNAPEYLGPEFEVGSLDILQRSHEIPEIRKIMEALVAAELVSVYKSYP